MSSRTVGATLAIRTPAASSLPDSRLFACGACGVQTEVTAYGMAMWMAMSELDRQQGGPGLKVRECVRCPACYKAHREALYSDVTDALFEMQEACRTIRQGRVIESQRYARVKWGPFSQSLEMVEAAIKAKRGGVDDLG